CQGRPVNEDDLVLLAQRVEESLRRTGQAEIEAQEVGMAILAFRFKYAVSDRGRLASFKTNVMEGTLLRGTLMGGYPTLKLK
ncbi:NUMOD4 domain-containing protein, partial [Klebsiella aerogenes]|uniref:NUMOD4 domain-containing protein n=1 Tax=Klebsiella aerogenes TaxID=548 RepID=UPI0021E15543